MQRPLISVSGRWRVERLAGTAAQIHGRAIEGKPTVALCHVSRSAVVLGSAQPEGDVDAARARAAGVDVVRRRSGGGAVFVDDWLVWVDVVLPRDDPLWDDDVGRATWWVGDVWADALTRLGVAAADLEVHRGAMVKSEWSPLVCFAGLGPGEVRVGGRKVVGVSQRRTRQWALFQSACLLRWHPDRLLALTPLPEAERKRAAAELGGSVAGLAELGCPPDGEAVEAALVAALEALED